MIRKIFQILATILFIYQLQQSIRKYFEYPVVIQTSQVPKESLLAPVIYICQADQFNQAKSESLGYKNVVSFLSGTLHGTKKISWHGKDGNLTYKELEGIVFEYDYTKLQLIGDYGTFEENIIMLPAYGICLKFRGSKSNPTIFLGTEHKLQIIFVDPSRANDIWTKEFSYAKATVGPSFENYYERAVYEIDNIVNDASIHDGNICTDYTKIKSSYQQCINTIANNEFESLYGCLPPWFPVNQSEKMCQAEMNKKSNFKRPEALKEQLDTREVKMLQKCMPPCITMEIKIQEMRYVRNRLDQARFKAFSKEWAIKHTEVYSYDKFDFLVDFGSALGLWLGMSCLSILDNILATWMSLRTYWKK